MVEAQNGQAEFKRRQVRNLYRDELPRKTKLQRSDIVSGRAEYTAPMGLGIVENGGLQICRAYGAKPGFDSRPKGSRL